MGIALFGGGIAFPLPPPFYGSKSNYSVPRPFPFLRFPRCSPNPAFCFFCFPFDPFGPIVGSPPQFPIPFSPLQLIPSLILVLFPRFSFYQKMSSSLANFKLPILLLLLLLPLLLWCNFVQSQDLNGKEESDGMEKGQSGERQAGANNDDQNGPPKCGTKETDFAPCLARDRADQLFKHCCSQYVPAGCHSLCQYEADELTARNLLLQAVKSKKCDLKHFGTILYCASQNQDNRKCCQHLNLADPKLGVGERCLRFCDPGGEGAIDSIARSDVTCLFNWNVLMYCHHSGIKLV